MATKQLLILRHARSSWDDPGLPDHERPLAPRGHRATEVLRRHLSSNAIVPALVLCSSARRARETLGALELPGQHLIEPELYGADADHLVDRLRRIDDALPSVMLIGHNPALQVLVLRLAGVTDEDGDDSDLGRIRRKFPTGGLATLEFDCAWRELGAGRARLSGLVRPKQLAGG